MIWGAVSIDSWAGLPTAADSGGPSVNEGLRSPQTTGWCSDCKSPSLAVSKTTKHYQDSD